MASQRCSLCAVNYPSGYGECLRCGGHLRYCPDDVTEGWNDIPAAAACSEALKVEMWRLYVLLEAGYSRELAEPLAAAATTVDLHQAVDLLERGCAPVTATAILL